MTKARLLTIGPFRFDPESGEVLGEGTTARLRPQSAAVLVLLASRPGRVVERDELRRHIWPAAPHGADPALNTCIREIRNALNDSASDPRWLMTIPRRGYRLAIAPARVQGARPASPSSVDPAAPARRNGHRLPLGLALAASLVTLLLMTPPLPGPGGDEGYHEGRLESLARARALLQTPQRSAWRSGVEVLDRFVEREPDYAPALAEAAFGRFRLQERDAARRLTARALAADPLLPRAHLVAGLIALYWDGDTETAARSLDRAHQLRPDDPTTRIALGYQAFAAGDPLDSPRLDDALAAVPATDMLLLDAAYLHYLHGSYARMIDLCGRALAQGSRRPAARCLVDAHLARRDSVAAAGAARLVVATPDARAPAETLARYWSSELSRAARSELIHQGLVKVKAAAHLGRIEVAREALEAARRAGAPAAVYAARLPYVRALDADSGRGGETPALEAGPTAATLVSEG